MSRLQYKLSVLSCILYFTITGCLHQNDKMPITSSSQEAIDNYLKGRDLLEKLQAQESIKYFEMAIAADSNFAVAYLQLSFVVPSAKEFFENLNKAVALSEKVSEAERLWILGVQAGTNGFPLKQREYYQKLITLYPNDERAYNLLGNNYFGQQEWLNAIKEFNKATTINPEFSQPYNQLGYAHRFLEEYDDAEKAFKKYIELIPNDPNPYDSYAELLMKIGKYEQSIELYKKALTLNPNFVPSHIGIASDMNFLGRYEEARVQLKKLEENARNDGEKRAAWFAMAVSYTDEGNTAKAIEALTKQYESNKSINDPAAMTGSLNGIGLVLLEAGRYDEAISKFNQALDITSKSDLSEEVKDNVKRAHLYNIASASLKKGDFVKAHANADEYSKQALKANNPNLIRVSHQLNGMIALAEKDYNTARIELKESSLQNPYNLYRIALAYQGQGDEKNAKAYFNKALNFNALNNINQSFVRNIMRGN